MEMVMTTIIISIATSLVVAALVTILGCYGFKIYIEREINRILDENDSIIDKYIAGVIELVKNSIRDAHIDK